MNYRANIGAPPANYIYLLNVRCWIFNLNPKPDLHQLMSHRILHISDSLINDNQYTTSSKTPLGGLSLAVGWAIEKNIDTIVHSGNLFHSQSVQQEVIDAIRDELNKLSETDTNFLCIRGDKDQSDRNNVYSKLVDENYIQRIDSSGINIDGIAFYGIDHLDSKQELKRELRSLSSECQKNLSILVTHQHLSPPSVTELADMPAMKFYSLAEVDLSIVLAGGMYEPAKWTDGDIDLSIIYSGATSELAVAPGNTITGTLIEVKSTEYKTKAVSLENI